MNKLISVPEAVSPVGETLRFSVVSPLGRTYPRRSNPLESNERDFYLQSALRTRNELEQDPREVCELSHMRYTRHFTKMMNTGNVNINSRVVLRLTRASIRYSLERLLVNAPAHDQLSLVRQFRELQAFEEHIANHVQDPDCKDFQQSFEAVKSYLQALGIQVNGPKNDVFPRREHRVLTLSGLPLDWREKVIANARTKIPNMDGALEVLSRLGCRPAELSSANLRNAGDGFVEITLVSKKALSGPAPVSRGGLYPLASLPRSLVRLVSHGHMASDTPFSDIREKQVAHVLASTSLRIFPKYRPALSPYAFRYQIASDLKKDGKTEVEIAQFLGHITTTQQSVYGRRRYGLSNSPWLPSVILQSHAVQQKLRPWHPPHEPHNDHLYPDPEDFDDSADC